MYPSNKYATLGHRGERPGYLPPLEVLYRDPYVSNYEDANDYDEDEDDYLEVET